MGYGDDIMATGYAAAMRREFPKAKAVYGDPDNFHDHVNNKLNVHWSEVFFFNPNIAQPEEKVRDVVCIPDYPGRRLYIDYEKCEVDGSRILRYAFRPEFRATPGQLFFSEEELAKGREALGNLCLLGPDQRPAPLALVEPNVKGGVSGQNKAWPFERWQAVADYLMEHGYRVLQLGAEGSRFLDRVAHVRTGNFRSALIITASLDPRSLVLTTDGAMHHAAAALGLKAVVVWTGFSSPQHLGYDGHVNLARGFDLHAPYGTLGPDPRCLENARAVEWEEVAQAACQHFEVNALAPYKLAPAPEEEGGS